MNEQTEQRLVEYLNRVERDHKSNGDKLGEIQRTLDDTAAGLDQVHGEIAELRGEVSEIKGEVQTTSTRLSSVESRIHCVEGDAGKAVEATARHELMRVRDQLALVVDERDRLRQSTVDWSGYAIKTAVGLIIMVLSGAIGFLLKGGSP